jgi:hypothetical protein
LPIYSLAASKNQIPHLLFTANIIDEAFFNLFPYEKINKNLYLLGFLFFIINGNL